MQVNPQGIPDLLKSASRWLCWSWTWVTHNAKWDKPPLIASSGRNASSTDPSTWTTFEKAYAAWNAGRFDGIGFALGSDPILKVNFSGFDLDRCIEGGTIRPDAVFLAQLLPSYTEYSPSGKGIKIFTLGKLPPGQRADHDRNFEIYDSGRYFTVTGQHVPAWPGDVCDCQQELTSLYHRLFPQKTPEHARLSPRELALAALAGLSPSRASGYNDWLAVGMALKTVSDDLLGEWDAWSNLCPDKYVAGACAKKWESFRSSGIGLGSLVFWAKENGWTCPASNGYCHAPRVSDAIAGTQDPHMGDGLTEQPGAGPWDLYQQQRSDPVRYLLRSPIWAAAPRLASAAGCVAAGTKDLCSWPALRLVAMEQSGIYVPHDSRKDPVWDGRDGKQLLRFLLANVKPLPVISDYSRILRAAEFILAWMRKARSIGDDAREKLADCDRAKLDDGSLIFKIGSVAAATHKEAPGITFEHLREAATTYGGKYCPRKEGKLLGHFYIFRPHQILAIEALLDAGSSGPEGEEP